jgi:hypothetical protein
MREIMERNSVNGTRTRTVPGNRKRTIMTWAVVSAMIMSTMGLVSFGHMSPDRSGSNGLSDMGSIWDSLEPQRAPYQASDGTLVGEGGNFGYSVSNAGDVDGDGYDDIIVGAPFYSGNKGRVYIYFGNDAHPSTADVTITGGATGDKFGSSVAGAGLYDDDAIDDVVIGATGAGANGEGKIYVFVGRSTWSSTYTASGADYDDTGENNGDGFGGSVSCAGDVDNDGDDEILVGAASYSSGKGKAYLYEGDDGTLSDYEQTWTGSSSGDRFGAVSSAGNVDGDNYDDIIIGAIYASSQYGQAYIYLGSSSGASSTADVMITGEASSSRFGQSVSDAGDVDNDGKDDIIIGSSGAPNGGRAYIFEGRSSWSSTYDADDADIILTAERNEVNNKAFGESVSSAGDYNNDNYDDVIVGNRYEDTFGTGGAETGRAHIYYGGSSMDNKVDVSMTGEAANDYFGQWVSNAGDYDNDGFDDVVVGAPYNDNPTTSVGRAYVYGFSDHVEDTASGRLGYSVSMAGDFDHVDMDPSPLIVDYYDDVVVGDPYYEKFTNQEWGRAYVYQGDSSMDNDPDYFLSSSQKDCLFGFSVSSGDFNNDGDGDIIVGAPGWDVGMSSDVGKVYIYFGDDGIDLANADVEITGENAGDKFGWSVSSAGKWGAPTSGNDNYEDVLVGAPGYSSDTGRAYLFYGAASMSSTISASSADVTFAAPDATYDELFGYSVSGAGDMDNDGSNVEELIIGSPKFNDGFSSAAGRVYLYIGDDADPSTHEATYTGETASDQFGFSVSNAGNMDNDNYDDIIIGAPKYSTSKGRAYVFKGASSLSGDTGGASASLIMTGESTSDQFGYSVSDAGNVNNDNYDDVVVGAPYNDVGGTDAGRVYVYYGSSSSDWNNNDEILITGVYESGAGERKGWSVSGAGDVNKDNYDDIIIGAPYRQVLVSPPAAPEGRIEIWGDPS